MGQGRGRHEPLLRVKLLPEGLVFGYRFGAVLPVCFLSTGATFVEFAGFVTVVFATMSILKCEYTHQR